MDDVTGPTMDPRSSGVPTGPDGDPAHLDAPLRPGTVVAHYTITRLLGVGGMGTVYLATQDKPNRPVALKLIRPGFASHRMLRRFEVEAEILGRLNHPNIARVYEAGIADTPLGRQPFFAMELIEGTTLDTYAHENHLATREKLTLFASICDAVQHAHAQGVIHRDLKPSNILITTDGHPKILDFGVARLTDADIRSATIRTDIGQLIGTVPYMSPEQAGGDPNDLDTRSDVYALGVVLYELLVERLPYNLDKKLIHEAVRIIREDDPIPLSSINRTLRGDVDTIVATALAKEKLRRYATPSALADDIRRYLRDEPIGARPASSLYQLRKFTRRNKALVGGIIAAFLLLVAGLLGTSYGLRQAIGARHRAETAEADAKARAAELELVEQFQESQLTGIDPSLMGARIRAQIVAERKSSLERQSADTAAIQAALAKTDQSLSGVNFTDIALGSLNENIFQRALVSVRADFADQPLVQARLLHAIANTMSALGLSDAAAPVQKEALDIRRTLLGNDHPDTLASIQSYGVILEALGQREEAAACYREALDARRKVLGVEHAHTINSLCSVGSVALSQGKLDEAESCYRQAIEISTRVRGADHVDTLEAMGSLALVLQARGKIEDAESMANTALAGFRRALGDDHLDTILARNRLGVILQAEGKLDEAHACFAEVLEARKRTLGDEHPSTLKAMANMGFVLQAQDKPAEAETYYRQALEGDRKTLGNDHPETLNMIANMGFFLSAVGRFDEAEPFTREALDGSRRVLGNESAKTLVAVNNMGALLQSMGKLADAEPFYRESLEGSRRTLGDDHPDTLISISNMGSLLRDLSKFPEADTLGTEAITRRRTSLPEGHWYTGVFLAEHAKTLIAMNRFSDAEPQVLEALTIFQAALGPDHTRTKGAMQSLINLYTKWNAADPGKGHDTKAAEWQTKLDAINAAQPAE